MNNKEKLKDEHQQRLNLIEKVNEKKKEKQKEQEIEKQEDREDLTYMKKK